MTAAYRRPITNNILLVASLPTSLLAAITMQDRQSYDLLVACQISTSPDNKDAHPQYPFSSGLQIRNASMTSIASNNSLRVSGGTNFGDTAQAASAMTSLLDVPPPPSVPVTTGSKSLRGKPTKKKASPKSKTKTSPKQGEIRLALHRLST